MTARRPIALGAFLSTAIGAPAAIAGSLQVVHNPVLTAAISAGAVLLSTANLLRSNFSRPLKEFHVRRLISLAAILAGRQRLELRAEWQAHLAGASGRDPVTWRKVRQALGFVAAAIQYRLADAADLAWRPVDAVLGSRTLSNLFVGGPVIVVLFAIVHHDGRFGLVADIQDAGELGAILYGVIRTGRWWRGIKPPPPKPRRGQKADSNADQGRPSPE